MPPPLGKKMPFEQTLNKKKQTIIFFSYSWEEEEEETMFNLIRHAREEQSNASWSERDVKGLLSQERWCLPPSSCLLVCALMSSQQYVIKHHLSWNDAHHFLSVVLSLRKRYVAILFCFNHFIYFIYLFYMLNSCMVYREDNILEFVL